MPAWCCHIEVAICHLCCVMTGFQPGNPRAPCASPMLSHGGSQLLSHEISQPCAVTWVLHPYKDFQCHGHPRPVWRVTVWPILLPCAMCHPCPCHVCRSATHSAPVCRVSSSLCHLCHITACPAPMCHPLPITHVTTWSVPLLCPCANLCLVTHVVPQPVLLPCATLTRVTLWWVPSCAHVPPSPHHTRVTLQPVLLLCAMCHPGPVTRV